MTIILERPGQLPENINHIYLVHLLGEMLESLSIANIVDISIIAALVYFVSAWFQGTRAIRIVATVAGMAMVYFASSQMGLVLTSVLFQYLWAAIIVVVVIVFQPEIREMLDHASPVRYLKGRKIDEPDIVDDIVRAVAELAGNKLGALIVFQRSNSLDSLLLSGKKLDSLISAEALIMLFQKTSPMHDGAAVICNGRIKAVSCILPLSKNPDLSLQYGTRHRAALGLTERSDAICVVCSEERGEVSLVQGKDIVMYRRKDEFQAALTQSLDLKPVKPTVKGFFAPFGQNIKLKALSAVSASVIWFVFVGPQKSEIGMSIPIQYLNMPQVMEITGQWMERIDVRLKGSRAGLENLRPGSIRATVELSNVVPGLNCFRMTEKNLTVPPGVSISQIRPTDLYLSIEAASIKMVGVVPTIIGSIPEKAKILAVPNEVRLRGFQDDLKKITAVTTEPIQVSELLIKGKAVVPVTTKPDGLRIDSIDPSLVAVSLELESPGSQ